jgi:hypothetical protein
MLRVYLIGSVSALTGRNNVVWENIINIKTSFFYVYNCLFKIKNENWK